MADLFSTLLSDPNTRWVLAACMLLGLASGVLGCFAVLRRHSLMGDAVAHAALPGICIAFMLSGSKSIGLFLIGAAVAGVLAAFCITAVTRYSRIKEDTALGLVLSVFFGVGIVLLTRIQHSPLGNQSGLDSFLFGKAASLSDVDVQVMMGAAAVLVLLCALLFKEFKLLSFDPGFGRGLGMPMGLFNLLLMSLIVLAVVIGLQAVGVVLMAAMLILPALAARYWTERLDRMMLLAGGFGALAGAIGTFVSAMAANLPTGPVIVLSGTSLFLLSLLFAPRRGLLAKGLRLLKLRTRVAEENVLQSLYDLTEKDGVSRLFTPEQIQRRRPQALRTVQKTLRRLEQQGLVERSEVQFYLTDRGVKKAYRLTLEQRMWEIFLMYEAKWGAVRIDRDAGDLDAQLPQDLKLEIKHLLRLHDLEPTLTPGGRIE
ncbi:manganese ABC transporter permease [Tumebacillus avium]|uniref:Manganese transport system membrane protein MntC n=1 Tax=Tumebacillus avium TaxID=1903704 RepID=A0A1Y0IVJ2_9BACL|nr:metal ABC transporter permease [Tumebacillus avium]ARU63505.1 manganese ABC transporter permease [Tumebacillus avium]